MKLVNTFVRAHQKVLKSSQNRMMMMYFYHFKESIFYYHAHPLNQKTMKNQEEKFL